MSERWDGLKETLRSELHNRGRGLGDDIPKGFYADIISKTGEDYSAITSVLGHMRRQEGCRPQADKTKTDTERSMLYKELLECSLVRTQPMQNTSVTDEASFELSKIWNRHPLALSSVSKRKRVNIIAGTGTPLAVSPSHSLFSDRIFYDELFVHGLLTQIGYRLCILTGTGESEPKAYEKNRYWYEFSPRTNLKIEAGVVDAAMLYDYVAKKSRRFSAQEIMMFFTHSGGSKKDSKYGDFRNTCERLTELPNRNVRIFAVFADPKGGHYRLHLEYFGFQEGRRTYDERI